jgi:hypothetical protein
MDASHDNSEENIVGNHEAEVKKDKKTTTSKLSMNPEQKSHNMKDLKTLDFNSDEIR